MREGQKGREGQKHWEKKSVRRKSDGMNPRVTKINGIMCARSWKKARLLRQEGADSGPARLVGDAVSAV